MSQAFEKVIKDRIFHGEYPLGSSLKSERDYAAEFGLSSNKVHRALQKLVQEGYLGSKRGSGYFVNTEFTCGKEPVKVAYIFAAALHVRMNEMLRLMAPQENIRLETIVCEGSEEAFNRAVMGIIERREHDLIIIHPDISMHWVDAFSMALEKHFPLIFYDYQDIPDVFPKIGINHFEFGFLGARIMKEHGYRQIMYLGYDEKLNSSARLRWQGFETGCRYFGLEYETLKFDHTDMRLRLAESDRKVYEWLELNRGQGRCLFASTGTFTFQVARCCWRAGFELPRDFGFLVTDFSRIEGLNYVSSCISTNPDQVISQIIKLIKQTAGSRTITESVSINITPIYTKGETL
jgi:DNA-binding LacI/PurR family transcriptional regulator